MAQPWRLSLFARSNNGPSSARCSKRAKIRSPHPHLGAMLDHVPHTIDITYCTQCRWLLRASWMAQELLSTFDGDIQALTLKPGTGGVFDVTLDGTMLWSRKEQGRFPEITELKQLLRDRIDPRRDLGHIDRRREKRE
jgi:selenoprotein W-related protein